MHRFVHQLHGKFLIFLLVGSLFLLFFSMKDGEYVTFGMNLGTDLQDSRAHNTYRRHHSTEEHSSQVDTIGVLHADRDAGGEEGWLGRCQHHLCTPHQQPARYYLCDANNRTWSLTFLAGNHWPNNEGPRLPKAKEYAGHRGWSGSVVRGLTTLGNDVGSWNYNPSHLDMLNDVIWTDNCPRARSAVRSGEARRTKFVVCGPVGTTWENKEDFTDPSTGFLIAPSSWVADRFRGENVRIRILVSGVDPEFFKPTVQAERSATQNYTVQPGKSVVLYLKVAGGHGFRLEDPFVQETRATLVREGWNVIPIVYGDYNEDEWRSALDRAVAAIFMTSTESQSIALAEAWSMDVPTFVYEVSPLHPAAIFGRWWPHANEGPYINYLNGARWSTIQGVLNLLWDMPAHPWNPREYVISTMTDKISVFNVLRAIECEWARRFPDKRGQQMTQIVP